jgi:hypothetical protein
MTSPVEEELWFRSSTDIAFPEDADCDAYVLAALMDAMREGRTLLVKGSVSDTLLSNLSEFQAAWSRSSGYAQKAPWRGPTF